MRQRVPGLRGCLPANGGITVMKRAPLTIALYIGFLSPAFQASAALAQDKIEGKVVATRLTHCNPDAKIGGCAGTLTPERKAAGKAEEIKIEVPLGTPITHGGETVLLPAQRGKIVVVTHVIEKKERVAKAIEAVK